MRPLVLALLAAVAVAQEAPPAAPPPPPPPPDLPGAEAVPLLPPEDPADVYGAPLATDPLTPAPAPAVLDAYRADPAFQYDDPQAEGPSLWEQVLRWLRRTLWDPVFENTTPDLRRYVLIALAVLALGWAVARLLRVEGAGVFARRSDPGGGAGPLLDAEAIAEVDLATRLRAALGAGDHREAVRVRYLLLLQALDASGALAWRRDKTNRQYVAEVRASRPGRARTFARATRVFDAVWYGERPVSPALYAELAPLFDEAAPASTPPVSVPA